MHRSSGRNTEATICTFDGRRMKRTGKPAVAIAKAFEQSVCDYLVRLGATEITPIFSRRFRLETTLGTLELGPSAHHNLGHGDVADGMLTIFSHFKDPDRAKARLDGDTRFSHPSGKWNFHYDFGYPHALADFQLSLNKVLQPRKLALTLRVKDELRRHLDTLLEYVPDDDDHDPLDFDEYNELDPDSQIMAQEALGFLMGAALVLETDVYTLAKHLRESASE